MLSLIWTKSVKIGGKSAKSVEFHEINNRYARESVPEVKFVKSEKYGHFRLLAIYRPNKACFSP
jgi:hypothetical protein